MKPLLSSSIRSAWWIVGVAVTAVPGCGGSEDVAGETNKQVTGEMLYLESHEDGNSLACTNCHALSEPASDGFRRPGHPIGDAFGRPSYKNGELTELRDAVNVCRTEWMAASAYSETDPRWIALRGFLEEQAAGASAPALTFEVVDPSDDLSGGDVAEGEMLFNRSCAACHGMSATGTLRAPALTGGFLDEAQIARRVRTGGSTESAVYDGLTGGRMPFWAADRLSDDELRNLIAFVIQNDPDQAAPTPPMNTMPRRSCPSTHPKIDQTATLKEKFHDVGGTATIVDDCTVEISNFTFDGTGIDVRFYSGFGGDYANGFSMSAMDLKRPVPYSGETVIAQLPEGRTLDELDGISVWCVPAKVSFGDGMF